MLKSRIQPCCCQCWAGTGGTLPSCMLQSSLVRSRVSCSLPHFWKNDVQQLHFVVSSKALQPGFTAPATTYLLYHYCSWRFLLQLEGSALYKRFLLFAYCCESSILLLLWASLSGGYRWARQAARSALGSLWSLAAAACGCYRLESVKVMWSCCLFLLCCLMWP